MDKNNKYYEISLFEIAVDCCVYYFLLLFWSSVLLLPLFSFIILLYKYSINKILYIIIIPLLFILISLIPYYISKGIIHRKLISIVIGILLSSWFVYVEIVSIIEGNIRNVQKILDNIIVIMLFGVIGIILVISLFLRRKYRK